MQAILNYFWQICLLRVGPEKIPNSINFTIFICSVYLALQVIATSISRSDLTGTVMLMRIGFSFTAELTILYTLLTFKKQKHRLLGSYSALFGCNSIMLLLTMPISSILLNLADGILLDFFTTLYVICLFWWFAIAGFIFHRAAHISLFQGIVIAISIELLVGHTTSIISQFMT